MVDNQKVFMKTTAGLQPVDGPVGRCFTFITEGGERSFGINAGKMDHLDVAHIPEAIIKDSSALVITAYLVRGDRTPLQPGMCFSNEPMIVVPDRFGIRLEDHFHMTDAGPQWFTRPQHSLDDPFADVPAWRGSWTASPAVPTNNVAIDPIRCGSAMSPTSRSPARGATWRPSWTATAAVCSAGRWAPNGPRR